MLGQTDTFRAKSNIYIYMYIYILISIALDQKCSPTIHIKQYKHFNKTPIHITEDHRSVTSFTEGNITSNIQTKAS